LSMNLSFAGKGFDGPTEFSAFPFPDHDYFAFCTFAATFRRSALSRMKPVASSWL
jgi:hypothetical protein